MSTDLPLYERIYAVVCLIPPGKVTTYGHIARLVGGCSARMVGYAMAATPDGRGIPWQRVINRKGQISPHGDGYGTVMQRAILEEEGVDFNANGCVDFTKTGWFPEQLP